MKGAKIGALFLVSLVALAGVGAGYAAWTDTLRIEGFVSTGSVGWRIIDHSATYVWKVYDCDGIPGPSHEIVIDYDHNTWATAKAWVDEEFADYCTIKYAAAAESIIVDDHHGLIACDNLFPDIDFKADFYIEYFGTIPGKISRITLENDQGIVTPYAHWFITVNGVTYDWQELYGIQLHQGDIIYVELLINFPELSELMSMPRTYFDVFIEIMQWNEFVPV